MVVRMRKHDQHQEAVCLSPGSHLGNVVVVYIIVFVNVADVDNIDHDDR